MPYRIFKPLFVFFTSIGLIVLLIILAGNEKSATIINESLKLYYGALGFFLLLNRMITPSTDEWRRWVIFLALGGFIGNFILCLCDHAQNGFFLITEWIPVFSSAFAVGFLTVLVFTEKTNYSFLKVCFF